MGSTRWSLRPLLATGLFVWAAAGQAVVLVHTNEVDFQGNLTATDRFWFYKYVDGSDQDPPVGDGIYGPLEQQAGRAWQIPGVAYVQGSTVVIRVQFKNWYANPIVANLGFSAFRLKVPPGPFRPNVTYINLTPPAPQQVTMAGHGGTADVTIAVNGLPSYVTLGNVQFQAFMDAISGYPPGINVWQYPVDEDLWGTFGRLYVVDQTPPAGLQHVPWTDLLEYSCSWAHGKTGVADVSSATTFGLYWGGIFAYNLGTPLVPPAWVDYQGDGKFYLKDLLDTFQVVAPVDANCVDVSGLLHIALAGLGHSSQLQRLIEEHEWTFITNKVCPIGSDGSNPDLYWHLPFSMHQQCLPSPGVCDAALAFKVNLSGGTHWNPAANWPMPGYWQTWAGSQPPATYGLVYRELLDSDQVVVYPTKTIINPDPSIGPRMIDYAAPYYYELPGAK